MTLEETGLTITIRRGEQECQVPLLALAAALRYPRDSLKRALEGLLFASLSAENDSTISGEPTEGVRSEPSTVSEQKEPIVESNDEGREARREGATAPITAELLADVLSDRQGLTTLRRLVDRFPQDLLRSALTETMALPDHRIRKSRGAYFTAAVHRRSTGR